jgi:hypothetical protein
VILKSPAIFLHLLGKTFRSGSCSAIVNLSITGSRRALVKTRCPGLKRIRGGSTFAALPMRFVMPRQKNETQTIRPTTEITDLFRQAAGRAHRFQAP